MFWNKKDKRDLIILCNSWPKAGTHLLLEMASIILRNKKEWYNEKDIKVEIEQVKDLEKHIDNRIKEYGNRFAMKGHIGYSKEVLKLFKKKNIKIFFIIRDPRDVICSTVRWVIDLRKNWEAHTFFKTLNKGDQISYVIKGLPNIEPFKNKGSCLLWDKPLKERYQNLTPWTESLDVCVLKYEDLSGNNGERQLEISINKVLEFLKIEDKSLVKSLRTKIINKNSQTFHTGKSGGWKKEFTEKNLKEFVESGSEELVRKFNYEPTQNIIKN
ncbi:MAG TPA: sulfotransferase domain-containing protein [Mariniflexile sp.]